MKACFQELLDIDHVLGVMVFSHNGSTLFEKFKPAGLNPDAGVNWTEIIKSFEGIQEGEFVFESKRFYLKRTARSYLLIIMESYAPAALLRLSCDVLVSSMGTGNGAKLSGVRGFFKRFK